MNLKMLPILMVLIGSVVCNAQPHLAGEAVIGGVPTKRHELKYQISLQFLDVDWCGGSIIDQQFAVTAAHCVVDEDNKFLVDFPFEVVAGINDLNNKNDAYKVKADVETIYIPSFYNRTSKTSAGDIAVLKLKQKLNLGPKSNLTKLELPPSSEKKLTSNNSYAGMEALVSGFGWDKVTLTPVKDANNKTKYEEDGSSDGKLLKAKALVIENSKCQSLYPKYVIHNNQICARLIQHPPNVDQGVCSGDSGSPLVVNEKILIGLVSYNYRGCNDKERPAVYTRLSAYVTFINNIKKGRITSDIRTQVWS